MKVVNCPTPFVMSMIGQCRTFHIKKFELDRFRFSVYIYMEFISHLMKTSHTIVALYYRFYSIE